MQFACYNATKGESEAPISGNKPREQNRFVWINISQFFPWVRTTAQVSHAFVFT